MACTVQLNIVEDNTAPDIVITIQRAGNTIDLTGATVKLILSLNGTITNTGHQDCIMTDAEEGIVTYTIQAADFQTAGDYLADVKITYQDNTVEIVRDQLSINARAKLGS